MWTVSRRSTPSGPEAVEAVRSVLAETLDRAAKGLAEGERVPWSTLADAGLLGLVVPEAHGGEGLGLDAVAVLLRETGVARRPAPGPRDARAAAS